MISFSKNKSQKRKKLEFEKKIKAGKILHGLNT